MDNEQNKMLVTVGADKAVPTEADEEVAAQPMSPAAVREAVVREVSSWKGVSVYDHRMGGVEFRVGRRELGHLHPFFADLPFPRRVRDELVKAGRARPHHVLPDSGWVTVQMRTASEAASVVELFRQNYERAVSARR
jgi:luciferase-like monooxygenase